MVNLSHIQDLVIKPALQSINLYSLSAERLLLFTGYVESGYKFLKQVPSGPALGFWQVERGTYQDIEKWLSYSINRDLRDRVLDSVGLDAFPSADALIWNLRLSVLMARMVYYRHKDPLPAIDDAEGMARYHKIVYNGGALGKANMEENAKVYKELYDV